jgi:predicted oxidoreductase
MDAIEIRKESRILGRSSLRAFPIAYGCWRFAGTTVREARAKIETAIEIGISLFDHADIYGGDGAAEALFGEVLVEAPHLRDVMLLATKCGIVPGMPYDSSKQHVIAAAEKSLRRLRTDVIDIYQIHRPDVLTHPEELAAALTALRQQGKIREVGVSNYTCHQVSALQRYLPFPIATQQPEVSSWALQPFKDGVIDQCMRERITPLAWSPLAGGRLGLSVEAARREQDGERLATLIARLDELAQAKGTTRIAIALAFLLLHPAGIIPIIGTQQLGRIRESAAGLDVNMSRSEWYSIVVARRGEALP